MQDFLDVHMHTIASGHAYSTLREMIEMGERRHLKLVGLSEHGPRMEGSCPEIYFCNFKVVRPECYGVDVVMGAELNIIDYAGSTDLSAAYLRRIDYAIASLHDICIEPGTEEQNTQAIVNAMRNPRVNIIGHPDNPYYPVDFRAIAKAAREQHVPPEWQPPRLVGEWPEAARGLQGVRHGGHHGQRRAYRSRCGRA